MTDKQDKRLLTPEEIEKVGDDAFKEDALLDHYVNTRGHWERIAPFIAKAQLAKIDKLKLDRPDREKLLKLLHTAPAKREKVGDNTVVTVDLERLADLILALFNEEEIRRQERERIWAWGLLMCDDYDHTNITLPSEMGGGKVKKNNRRRARCAECWRTLLGKP